MNKFEKKLTDLGVTLADAPAPAANYVPFVQVGDMLFVSGQISRDDEGLITGKVGDDLSVEAGLPPPAPVQLRFCLRLKRPVAVIWTALSAWSN